MTDFFLDPVSGNDANDGTTFANRWKTFTSGATSARTAPGDRIKIIASPDPTSIGNATWTHNSNTVTLASAVTLTITNCETAWTQSANVTCSRSSASPKEGTYYVRAAIATAFTTGLAAYFATGTLDLSAYQQVSFWIRLNSTLADSATLSLRLCTDTVGATSVHTIAIPAQTGTDWRQVTVDLGTNLNSAIKSIAIYQDTDRASINVDLDNIIACKASASADALSLVSLIGKCWNQSWATGTGVEYEQGDRVRPTQPNRNGLVYEMVTTGSGTRLPGGTEPTWPLDIGQQVVDGECTWECVDFEDTWWGIQSIDGTTIKLDHSVDASPTNNIGYWGETETVDTFKREPLRLPGTTALGTVQEAGTWESPITYSGGWDRTNMSTQSGETWIDMVTGVGTFATVGQACIVFRNVNVVRASDGFNSGNYTRWYSCHANNCLGYGFDASVTTSFYEGCSANKNKVAGIDANDWSGTIKRCAFNCSSPDSAVGVGIDNLECTAIDSTLHLIGCYGNYYNAIDATSFGGVIDRLYVKGDTRGAITIFSTGSSTNRYLTNPVVEVNTTYALGVPNLTYIHNENRVAGAHRIQFDESAGCEITPDASQRHTASGYSWNFHLDVNSAPAESPMYLVVARLLCEASVEKNVSIWTRRSSTDIKARLRLPGGQLAGLPMTDLDVTCEPSINTWTESSPLTFTPTETGVVEIKFIVWTTTGTNLDYWIDDLEVA